MNTTKKLAISFTTMSLVAVGIGFAATLRASSLQSLALVAAGGLALALILALAFGASVDRKLGAEPEEIRRRAAELAGGYLAPLSEGSAKRGAAAQLDLASAQLNTVFRAARETARAAIVASRRIGSLSLLGSGDEEERRARGREIGALAEELAREAGELEKAIGFYSFAAQPRARAEDHGVDGRRPAMESPRRRPSRGHRPRLRLIKEERPAPLPSADLAAVQRGTELRLIVPAEDARE